MGSCRAKDSRFIPTTLFRSARKRRTKRGYTVAILGCNTPDGVDAIQFEFGSNYRQTAVLDKSAGDAAAAIVAFYDAYLKNPRKQ